MGPLFRDKPEEIRTIMGGGKERLLAALMPHETSLAAARHFADHFEALSPSQWQECDYTFYGTPLWDQEQHGTCTNAAGGDALERVFRMAGFTPPLLSRTFAYAQVNGGRDQGASVTSILKVFETMGVCTDAQCGVNTIFKQQLKQAAYDEAKNFTVPADTQQGAYLCRNFADLCSALSLGFPVVFGITIGQNFNNLSAEGIVPIVDVPRGGHALSGCGLARSRNGSWVVKFQNSWGPSWGLQGFAYIGEASFNRGMIDAYALVLPDLANKNPPPPVVGSKTHFIPEKAEQEVAARVEAEPSAEVTPLVFQHEDIPLKTAELHVLREAPPEKLLEFFAFEQFGAAIPHAGSIDVIEVDDHVRQVARDLGIELPPDATEIWMPHQDVEPAPARVSHLESDARKILAEEDARFLKTVNEPLKKDQEETSAL